MWCKNPKVVWSAGSHRMAMWRPEIERARHRRCLSVFLHKLWDKAGEETKITHPHDTMYTMVSGRTKRKIVLNKLDKVLTFFVNIWQKNWEVSLNSNIGIGTRCWFYGLGPLSRAPTTRVERIYFPYDFTILKKYTIFYNVKFNLIPRYTFSRL